MRRLHPRHWPGWLRIAVPVTGTFVLFVLVLWLVPIWETKPYTFSDDDAEAKQTNDNRQTTAQIIGGALLILGGYFTYRQLGIAQQMLTATQDKQLSERFAKAIEQLGSDRLELRLGGIYSLESIARESARDHWPVMEVLTAYIHTHVPWPPGPDAPPSDAADVKPKAEIQAVLTVLGRRTHRQAEVKAGQRLDLRETDLRSAKFSGGNLDWAIFNGAQLDGASFDGASFVGALLWGASLQGAGLEDARLDGADFRGATLWGSAINGAGLIGANFLDATLEQVSLEGADLTGANLERASLEGADLSGANLTGATGLTQEQLVKADGDTGTRLPPDLEAARPTHWRAAGDATVSTPS